MTIPDTVSIIGGLLVGLVAWLMIDHERDTQLQLPEAPMTPTLGQILAACRLYEAMLREAIGDKERAHAEKLLRRELARLGVRIAEH